MPKSKNSNFSYKNYLLESFCLVFLFLLTAINLNNYFSKIKVLGISTESMDIDYEKKNSLKQFITENPTYFDALIELTRLELIENSFEEAKKYLDLAKNINPNSIEVKEIEKEVKTN